ncbi:MAG: hypothetical protein EAZ89_05695 [Bacteroidetes bacterium]|nr:MAG: hypothetical protein EAZ89_05695 [Bacteroidota bacterium]
MVLVEHFPEVVLSTLQKNPATREWFYNEWIHLVAVHPESKELYRYQQDAWMLYRPLTEQLGTVSDIAELIESHQENFPVYLITPVQS